MRHLLFHISCLLFLSSCSLVQTDFQAKVVAVKDGDSLEVLDSNQQRLIIRLSHIDCPEYGQPYSNAAKKFASDFSYGKQVTLEQTDTDRYGRLVCEVFVEGESLNLALVKNGLAWHHRRYSDDPDFADAEEDARDQKIGLWADPNAVPPWKWRKERRNGE